MVTKLARSCESHSWNKIWWINVKENEARKNNKINRYINIYIYILYSVETFKFSLLPRYDIYLPIAYIYIYTENM